MNPPCTCSCHTEAMCMCAMCTKERCLIEETRKTKTDIPTVISIQAFRTSDGTLFESETDAIRYERKYHFIKWYESATKNADTMIWDNDTQCYTGVKALTKWLDRNAYHVLKYLGVNV